MLRRHARRKDSGEPEQAGVATSRPGIGTRARSVPVCSADHPQVPAGNRNLCDPVRRYAAQAPQSRLRSIRALAQVGSRRRHRHRGGHHRPVRAGADAGPAGVRRLRLVAKQEDLTCITNGHGGPIATSSGAVDLPIYNLDGSGQNGRIRASARSRKILATRHAEREHRTGDDCGDKEKQGCGSGSDRPDREWLNQRQSQPRAGATHLPSPAPWRSRWPARQARPRPTKSPRRRH